MTWSGMDMDIENRKYIHNVLKWQENCIKTKYALINPAETVWE